MMDMTMLAGCVRLELQIPYQLQQRHNLQSPSNKTLQIKTFIKPIILIYIISNTNYMNIFKKGYKNMYLVFF